MEGLYIDLVKAITRDQASSLHKKLPPNGKWKTVNGHHIYLVGGKIVAGGWADKDGKPQKSTKEHIAQLQAHLDGKATKAQPVKAAKQPKAQPVKAASPVKATKPTKAEPAIPEVQKKNPTKPTKMASYAPQAVKTANKPKVTTTVLTVAESASSLPKPKKAVKKKANPVIPSAPKRKNATTIEGTVGYKPKSGKKKVAEAVKKMEEKRKAYNKKMKANKKARDADAKPILSVAIKQKSAEERAKAKTSKTVQKQDSALAEWGNLSETDAYMDNMWGTEPVKRLMNIPAEMRSEEDIRKVAGAITEANDKLARHITLQFGAKRGLELTRQMNKINDTMSGDKMTFYTEEQATDDDGNPLYEGGEYENAYDENGNQKYHTMSDGMQVPIVKKKSDASKLTPIMKKKKHTKTNIYDNPVWQETGYYGDLLQEARATMYTTLHNVLAGSQNPSEGVNMSAHVIQRMKQALDRELQGMMNMMPVPEEMRPAIGVVNKAEQHLAQMYGRTPTDAEIGEHIQSDKKFMKAPVNALPKWDAKKGEWIPTREDDLTPEEKVRMIKLYAARQKATTLNQNIGLEGEREIELQSNIKDDPQNMHPEDVAEKLDKQADRKTMGKESVKALKEIGLTDDERKVFVSMAVGDEYGDSLTQQDIAKKYGMKQQDVSRILMEAFKKMADARKNSHPAIERLKQLFKAMKFDLLKALYEYDLVKSLTSWGISVKALIPQFVRIDYSDSLESLTKSLNVSEYIGSYVITEDGSVHARIVELTLPDDNVIYKAFTDEFLQKGMFPHKGKKHEVAAKISQYAKSNPKLKELSEKQHSSVHGKGGGALTWSEQLLIKNPGSAWITYGGKRVLVHTGTGDIIYSSDNDMHRAEYNKGASEDKIDYHHEQEAYTEHHAEREKQLRTSWDAHIKGKEQKAQSGKTKDTFDYGDEQEKFAKANEGVSFDKQGNFQYSMADYDRDKHGHLTDHGLQELKKDMEKFRAEWHGDEDKKSGLRFKLMEGHEHKVHHDYQNLSEKEKASVDKMSEDERKEFFGKRYLNAEGVRDLLKMYHKAVNTKGTLQTDLDQLEGQIKERLVNAGSMGAKNSRDMDSFFNALKDGKTVKGDNPSTEAGWKALEQAIGQKEANVYNAQSTKVFPEGHYMVGNPLTGKTVAVKIGTTKGKSGQLSSGVVEAFDVDSGEQVHASTWGQLARAMGFEGDYANNFQENLLKKSNKQTDKAFLKMVDEDEYGKNRAKSQMGLQENTLHTGFKLVHQSRDKDGNLQSNTYAMTMPDGSENKFEVNAKGYIQDPVMARLINQKQEIHSAEDLHAVLRNAIGNKAWVTAHFGSDIHIGDALGHHVQLEYDGKGAPRVVGEGSKYEGYRFMDSRDVPRGAIDPATGEPIKAMFHNGKLVDRKFTTKHDVPFAVGNEALIPNGKDGWKKGKIVGKTDSGDWVVKDTKGIPHVYKASELKNAKGEGYTKSDSGMATVRLAKKGTHRLNEADAGLTDNEKKILSRALKKAKIASDSDDEKGNHTWSDTQRSNLEKHLRKEPGGSDIISKINTVHTKELEVHVPESMRNKLISHGIEVHKHDTPTGKAGTARISVGKFEELRDAFGGMSIAHDATSFLNDHFNRKDRMKKTPEELVSEYQPAHVDASTPFGKHYVGQFKPGSFLLDKNKGLYGVQLEGVNHLITRGRGIVGHGINNALAMTFVA